MKESYEEGADCFLELASRQRLNILEKLSEKKSKISIMAKELDATAPEVHRNFDRLTKSNLIVKDNDGFYHLTAFGKMILTQVPSMVFMASNKRYFQTHEFGSIPIKFIQRIGALEGVKHVKGFVRVQEHWNSINKDAEEYIYNILYEAPYTPEIIQTLAKKVKCGVKLRSIFLESAIVPKERDELIKKSQFKKFVQDGLVERRMIKDVSAVVFLNEKEACVSFSKKEGDIDVSEMFYGDNKQFHEWCYDFFNYHWYESSAFQESKLGKEE